MDGEAASAQRGATITRRTMLVASFAAAGALLPSCAANFPATTFSLPARAWGAFLSAPASQSRVTLDRFAALAGAEPDLLHLYASTRDSPPQVHLDTIRQLGATPVLSLEPWNPRVGRYQPEFSLSSIVAGQHDSDLQRWAAELDSWGHAVLLRFAQEMNGTWYPWSVGLYGNTAAEYRAAWVRMHRIVSAQAPNVEFVWAPNVLTEGSRDFADCYPGDRFVDHLGLDGYNWGDTPGHQWQSPEKLFSASVAALRRLSATLPIVLTEVGCAGGADPGQKARWISEFFDVVMGNPDVTGFMWFQTDKERDWRINSSPTSTQAFRDGLSKWISS
ncbi:MULTISPECIES: glycosyl hydrolase [unclassified Gordonia (in: high G+C Gram-positive bacteria)]|uniref:glycoside hydrolase family 26 protein n=1 Tax=unclassified Gordonia (in: high G+C Gram-positive bacteria) TaxID=2657482 RepID=UPI0020183208|nr:MULTISPECIES: glycosyl hydrolase [unclassified Gordonia (in: high G+C Gram-positive bacteria)]